MIQLAPFAKTPMRLTLRGITTDGSDFSVRRDMNLRLAYPNNRCAHAG